MVTIISLFNHKGGVSKTTTTFNLGWILAEQGKRVLMVDGDPQCNLTGTVLGFNGMDDFESFYERWPTGNISGALRPAFEGRPQELQPARITPVRPGPDGLYILAGHIDFATYEPQLAVALSTGTALPALHNLPGAISALLQKTAENHRIDIILIDMSPSVGALNQALFLSSDFFIVPASPDYYCYQAVESLATILPRWDEQVESLRRRRTEYRLPMKPPKFLGLIPQRYRPRGGSPAGAFQQWIDRINEATQQRLVPALSRREMTISEDIFKSVVKDSPAYILAQISDFNSLIAQSQQHNTPIFALSDEQIERQGVVLRTMRRSRDEFRRVFEELGRSIVSLVSAAS